MIIFCLSVYYGHLNCFHFLAIMNNAATSFVYMCVCVCVCACVCACGFNFLGYIPRSRISELYDDSLLYILRNCQTISKATTPFYIPTSNLWGFQFLHIPVNTSYCLFCPVDVKGYLIVVLIYISLMTDDVEHHFMYLLAICIFSLGASKET